MLLPSPSLPQPSTANLAICFCVFYLGSGAPPTWAHIKKMLRGRFALPVMTTWRCLLLSLLQLTCPFLLAGKNSSNGGGALQNKGLSPDTRRSNGYAGYKTRGGGQGTTPVPTTSQGRRTKKEQEGGGNEGGESAHQPHTTHNVTPTQAQHDNDSSPAQPQRGVSCSTQAAPVKRAFS